MAAGPVPEPAIPRVRPRHVRDLLARQQFHRRAELRPLLHAPFGNPDAAGRMHRLHPTGLLLLGLDLVLLHHVEQDRGAVAQHGDEALADLAVLCDDITQARGYGVESLVPCHRHELPAAAHQRLAQASRAIDELKAPTTPVTQPAIINRIIVA